MTRALTPPVFRFLIKPPLENPELIEQLAKNLGQHNAHFARADRAELYHRERDGHYVVVATRKESLAQVFRTIIQTGFILGGAHFPDTEPGKNVFVTPYQLAARLS